MDLPSNRSRRAVKAIALAAVAALAGVLLFLLASASANTSLFARNYPLLLAANGVLVVLLGGTVAYQLRKAWHERRASQFGSRLKLRLLLMFAAMAILPGALIYAVSMQFAVRSIESWFDVRVDAALEGGLALGQSAFDYLLDQLEEKTHLTALGLADAEGMHLGRLNRLREEIPADQATVFTASGQLLAASSADIDPTAGVLPRESPDPVTLRNLRDNQGLRQIEGLPDGRLQLRVVVALPVRQLLADPVYLQAVQAVPDTIARHADNVQEAFQDYQQLSLGREGLKQIFTMTLTLTLLLALFAAMAVAVVLARRLAAPLRLLAEGTQAVAQGDFSPRRALPARDELGVLTQSFSQMTRQLDEARGQAERNRMAVEGARAYLESVLANLSAGVLAFDPNGTLRAANAGATSILSDELIGMESVQLSDWPRHDEFREAVLRGFAENDADWNTQVEMTSEQGLPQTLLIHGSRLPESSGGGFVVVFDDISHLISAQRTAAWAEVARRVAHEIKNPLTPIQLSAERLEHKLSRHLDDDNRAMLARSCRTIVSQVEAMKNLVNAFRDYAKLPAPVLSPLDLNQLVREVAALYEASPVRVRAQLGNKLPAVLGDAGQLRQVIHNLLQNAEDAVRSDNGNPSPSVEIITRQSGTRVALVVRDNGAGFPPDVLPRALEPYFTTRTHGSGLGLAIVKKIIDEHGGDIRITNREAGGAEVRVRLRTERN
ncbi:MAG: HAMP domain-containing protein [Rhodocyclaceae bacterium]|nr:HAMP domain-containing protein [Rhodocyclaceae bacterium]